MARGTDFGGVHSFRDLHLIQQKVEISPATPKLNFVDVPGADGSKDLSEMPAGRVAYNDRTIKWTFALYPEDKWADKHRAVSNALNGLSCDIILDDDLDYYFQGRVAVKSYKVDSLLRQITVEATCRPYMLKRNVTEVTAKLSSGAFTAITLHNERKPVAPTIRVTAETTLRWGGTTLTHSAGTFVSLDIELQTGDNVLEAKTTSGTGEITVTYQEGSL